MVRLPPRLLRCLPRHDAAAAFDARFDVTCAMPRALPARYFTRPRHAYQSPLFTIAA